MFMNNTQDWIRINCPLIWSTLNNRAKNSLPKGIIEFLETGAISETENGHNIFLIMEKYLNTLIGKINSADVNKAYSRELSNVNDEKQLSELFSKIAVCATISKISTKIFLKPETKKPKRCDFKAELDEYDFYGEVKRFEDRTKIISRSILSDNNYKIKQKTTRPRFLELESKLQDVHKQLPEDTVNIVFLFHSSIGETISYVKQVLFGESNFWNNKIVLEPKSLFSKYE